MQESEKSLSASLPISTERTIIPNSQNLCNDAVRWCPGSTYLGLAWYSVMVAKATRGLLNPGGSGTLRETCSLSSQWGHRRSPDISGAPTCEGPHFCSATQRPCPPACSFLQVLRAPCSLPPASGPLHVLIHLSGVFLPSFTSLTKTHLPPLGSRFMSSSWTPGLDHSHRIVFLALG